jgi:type VI secretion system secreted protein Hcp
MSVDMFLEFDADSKIVGESIDDKHGKCLQIDGFSFGAEMPASAESGTGLGAGKVKFDQFNFKTKSSLASAPAFRDMYSGKHIKKATLYLRKAGGTQEDYMKFIFKELIITKYAIDGSGEEPTEDLAFAYTGLYVYYAPQDQKGAIDNGNKRDAGWDVKANKEWLGT